MNFLSALHTDIGIRKKTNQDSMLLQEAKTDKGNALLAVVCDGMGGLAMGEVASAAVINAFEKWFATDFATIIEGGFSQTSVKKQWESLLFDLNTRINQYGDSRRINLGTTVAALLLFNDSYCIINVGDSWVCEINSKFQNLTKDQTLVQREIDAGRMTPEQAKTDPQRNVLLQCVGTGSFIEPDFYTGINNKDKVYLLCSDGYRHVVKQEEFIERLNPDAIQEEADMQQALIYFTELNKYRREDDNMSAILIRTV